MATKKHNTGDLSRRDFIKTTTTATAAASVGIMPGSRPETDAALQVSQARGVGQPAWVITDKEIFALWNDIWPKILALSWLDPDVTTASGAVHGYRTEFNANASFRVQQAHHIAAAIGVKYNSNIPILTTRPANLNMPIGDYVEQFLGNPDVPRNILLCAPRHDNVYGETYFMINEEGIIMPWPDAPNMDATFVGYYQGSGVIPRRNPSWITDAASPEYGLLDNLANNIMVIATSAPRPFNVRGLSGAALLMLFEKWPRTIAEAWHSCQINGITCTPGNTHVDDIMDPATRRKYIMPEVWSRWPHNVIEEVVQRPTELPLATGTVAFPTDFILEHQLGQTDIHLEIPIPQRPASLDDVYKELIVGYASNPLYTNTY